MLGLPVEEVVGHVMGAMTTLGVRSKLEALMVALRHSLIVLPTARCDGSAGMTDDRVA